MEVVRVGKKARVSYTVNVKLLPMPSLYIDIKMLCIKINYSNIERHAIRICICALV